MASLYLTIKMTGLGWGSSAEPREEDYRELCELIVKTVRKDEGRRFAGEGKAFSVQIRGYDPLVKGILVAAQGVVEKTF